MTTPDPKTPVPADDAKLQAAVKEAALAAATAERKRISDINALCSRAGEAKLAAKMIDEGTSLEAAGQILLESMLSKGRILGEDIPGAGGGDPAPKKDIETQLKEEYAKDAKSHLAMGVSEADFIMSKKIDLGLVPLEGQHKPV